MTPQPAPQPLGPLQRRIQERREPVKPAPWVPEWRKRLVAKDYTGKLS